MKKKKIIPITLINLFFILAVMTIIAIFYQDIIEELTQKDIRNVTLLTEANIYKDLQNELIEPVNTSMTMAQNTLLEDFMNEDGEQTELKLSAYLTAIQELTGYESVFVVPHQTLNYYHPGGTQAKVDLSSDSSYWYKASMKSNKPYSLSVNTEQLDDYALTVYVNVNMYDDQGQFIGLTGVGKRLTHFQDILSKYVENQGVEAYLIDQEGLIQIHEKSDLVQNINVYDYENISREDLLLDQSEEPTEIQIDDSYITIHHMPLLDWYLVVKKSTSELRTVFDTYNYKIFIILIVAAIFIMTATSLTISRYKRQITKLSNTDALTSLPNRAIFDSTLKQAVKNMNKTCFTLALFDLDNLKQINDEMGHDRGDYALEAVGKLATDLVGHRGLVSRVGGDEFGIVMTLNVSEAEKLMIELLDRVHNDPQLNKYNITISIGLTEAAVGDNESLIYKRADKALYVSKNGGKNKYQIIR